MRYAKTLRSGVRSFRRAYVRFRSAALADFPLSPRRTLVVAPHPDDEVFGTGGLIAAKRALGAAVSVLFLTSGEASHNGCCGIDERRISTARRELARQAARRLGADPNEYVFLGFPDGKLPRYGTEHFEEVAGAVREVFEIAAPEEVFCTHPAEVWSDHVAAPEIVQHVWRQTACPATNLWHYLVWAPLNQSITGLRALDWFRARKLSIEPWRTAKQLATKLYLQGKPEGGCPRPWVGSLPPDLLEISESPYEVYFEADSRPRDAVVSRRTLAYGLSMAH